MMQLRHSLEVRATAGEEIQYLLDGRVSTKGEYTAIHREWMLEEIASLEKQIAELQQRLEGIDG